MTTEHKNPKNQKAEKPQNSKQRKSPAKRKPKFKYQSKSSLRTSSITNFSEILAPLAAKHSILSAKSKEDAFELVGTEIKSPSRPMAQGGATELKATVSSSEKPGDQVFQQALGMLKGVLFKRDQPYRTLLPLQGGFITSSGGSVNITQSVASISSTSEWSSIDALFDEMFVHTMTFRFFPINNLGGGVGGSVSAGVTGGITTVADTIIVNAPIQMVNLFNGAATYSTAAAMAANATLAIHSSSRQFKYTWRNNVRFDPRGVNASATGWQGWTPIADASSLGGQIQFRAMQDSTIGSGSAFVTMGSYLCQYDVSFRARS